MDTFATFPGSRIIPILNHIYDHSERQVERGTTSADKDMDSSFPNGNSNSDSVSSITY